MKKLMTVITVTLALSVTNSHALRDPSPYQHTNAELEKKTKEEFAQENRIHIKKVLTEIGKNPDVYLPKETEDETFSKTLNRKLEKFKQALDFSDEKTKMELEEEEKMEIELVLEKIGQKTEPATNPFLVPKNKNNEESDDDEFYVPKVGTTASFPKSILKRESSPKNTTPARLDLAKNVVTEIPSRKLLQNDSSSEDLEEYSIRIEKEQRRKLLAPPFKLPPPLQVYNFRSSAGDLEDSPEPRNLKFDDIEEIDFSFTEEFKAPPVATAFPGKAARPARNPFCLPEHLLPEPLQKKSYSKTKPEDFEALENLEDSLEKEELEVIEKSIEEEKEKRRKFLIASESPKKAVKPKTYRMNKYLKLEEVPSEDELEEVEEIDFDFIEQEDTYIPTAKIAKVDFSIKKEFSSEVGKSLKEDRFFEVQQ